MRPTWRFETGVFLGLLLAILALVPTRLFQDPGVFWHTRLGLQILETGELPQGDTFTYTKTGEPWICQYWLCEMGMAGLYRLGGWDSLLLVTAVLLAGTYAWLTARLYGAGLDGVVAVLIGFLAVAASAPQFHVRPLVFTLTFMGLELVLLADVEAGRRPLRQMWWLVPLFVLWTNIHGGVIGGLATLALVTAGWLLWGLLRLDGPIHTLREGLHLAGISIVCALTVLANPYGLRMPMLWFEILRLPLSEFVIEHAPLWRERSTAIAPVVLLCFFLPFALSVRPKTFRVTWLMPIVWFLLSCQKSRHASIFAVTVLAVLPDMLPRCAFRRFLEWRELYSPAAESASPAGSPAWRRWVVPVAIVVAALGLQAAGIGAPLIGAGCAKLDRKYWPVDLLPQLQEIESLALAKQADAGGPRIFNDDLYGGFLIFHTPGLPVFIDDRCELFGEAFLREYVEMCLRDPAAFDRADERWGFTHALVKRGTAVEGHLRASQTWTLLGETPRAALFGKKPAAPGL